MVIVLRYRGEDGLSVTTVSFSQWWWVVMLCCLAYVEIDTIGKLTWHTVYHNYCPRLTIWYVPSPQRRYMYFNSRYDTRYTRYNTIQDTHDTPRLLRSLQASSAQLCSAIKGTGRDPFPPIKWGTKKQLSKTGINKIVGIPLLYIRLSIGTRKINHHFKVISLGLPTEESTHCDQWTRHLMSHLSKGNPYIIE